MNEKLIFTDNAGAELDSFISGLTYAGTIVITDTNVEASVLPKFAETSDVVKNSPKIVIPVGDDNKTIDTLASVWKKLSDMEAVRKTIVVNIGGGVVTDLGGFAARSEERRVGKECRPRRICRRHLYEGYAVRQCAHDAPCGCRCLCRRKDRD